MPSSDPHRLPRELHVGTSSFSSKGWTGPFYPPGTPPAEFLRLYADRFHTVEIDSTWYRSPSARTVDGWAQKTPAGFLFAAKVPKRITHELYLEGCGEEWAGFLRVMARLGEKLGPLLLQFPYVAKKKDPEEYEKGAEFLRRMKRFLPHLPADLAFAVEVRNARWLGDPLYDLLRSRGISLVLADYYTMPRPPEIFAEGDPLTASFSYLRFLGHHRWMDKRMKEAREKGECAEDWSALLVDRSRETREWVPFIQRMIRTGSDVFAFFNNHFAGYAPGSIEVFLRVWEEEGARRQAPRPLPP